MTRSESEPTYRWKKNQLGKLEERLLPGLFSVLKCLDGNFFRLNTDLGLPSKPAVSSNFVLAHENDFMGRFSLELKETKA